MNKISRIIFVLFAFSLLFSFQCQAQVAYIDPFTGEITSEPVERVICSDDTSYLDFAIPTGNWNQLKLYLEAVPGGSESVYAEMEYGSGYASWNEGSPIPYTAVFTQAISDDNNHWGLGCYVGDGASLKIVKIELLFEQIPVQLLELGISSKKIFVNNGFSPGLNFTASTAEPADVSFTIYDNLWNIVYESVVPTTSNSFNAAAPADRNIRRSYLPGDDETINKARGYWDLKNALLPLPGFYTLEASVDGDSRSVEFEVQSTEASQIGNYTPNTPGGFDQPPFDTPDISTVTEITQGAPEIVTPQVGDPVNLVSGNLYTTETDLLLKSRLPLTLQRTYNSVDPQIYLFGRGWTCPYSSHLEISDSAIVFVQPDGGRKLFELSSNSIVNPIGSNLQLSICGDGWQIINPSGAHWIFNSNGRLITMTSPGLSNITDNSINLSYDENGVLKTVSNPSGQFYSFSYNDSELIASVSDSTGRSTSYQYDENKNLISFTNALGQITAYQYDSQNMLSAINQPGNYLTEVTYENGRVVSLAQANGINIDFVWNPENYLVSCSDSAGIARTYQFNENWKLTAYTIAAPGKDPISRNYIASGATTVGYIDANGHDYRYSYDQNNNLIETRDPLSNTSLFDIDVNTGQKSKISDATGRTWHYNWNNIGKLDSLIDPINGQTTFAYNDNGLCVSATDPLGRITYYKYSDNKAFLTEIIDTASASTRLAYDARGNLIKITDPLARATIFSYDQLDRLTKTVYADQSFVEINYDAAGNIVSRRDNTGRTTMFAYDSNRRLVATTFPDNTVETYITDSMGRKISQTDQLGRITTFEYDQRFEGAQTAKLTKITFPDGSFESFDYDNEGNLIAKQNTDGNRYAYEYDAANRLIATTDPIGNKWESTMDAAGRISSIKDPLNRLTSFQYNHNDQLTQIIRPDGLSVKNDYDIIGNLISTEDALGNLRAYEFDNAYRVIREIQPGGAATAFSYDQAGQKVSETDALGRVTRFAYDNAGRIQSITDPANCVWRFEYDTAGRLKTRKNPLGASYATVYDAMDRIIAATDPLGYATVFEYDPAGRMTAAVDAMNRRIEMTYDNRDQLLSEADPEGRITLYTHDNSGQLVSRTDAEGKTWRWQYDAVAKLKTEIDPLGNTRHFEYDAAGNLTSKTNGRAQVVNYNYDLLNRLVKVEYPDQKPVTINYDAAGHETSRENENSKVIKTWNALGNLTSEKFSIMGYMESAKGWSYSYDKVGNRIKGTSPEGHDYKYQYDARNNLVRLSLPDWHDSINYAYDPAGQLIGSTRPGIKHTNRYDLSGRLTDISYEKASGMRDKVLASRHYKFDAIGNPLQIKDENNAITSLAYNGANWLTRVAYPEGQVVAYDYDQTGNRIAERIGSASALLSGYDGAGRLVVKGNDIFSYDNDGNLTDSVENGINTRYSWNSSNQLLNTESPTRCQKHCRSSCNKCPTRYDSIESYSYFPADWRRSIRKTAAASFVSLYDGDDESHEYLAVPKLSFGKFPFGFLFNRFKLPETVLQREFISGPYSDDIEVTSYKCRDLHHLKDGIGSTIALANRSGSVVARMNYDAWGNFRWPAKKGQNLPPCKEDELGSFLDRLGSVFAMGSAHDPWHYARHYAAVLTPYLYAGRRYQASTGMYFNRHRYYQPQSGRFISSDPLGFAGGNNLWGYANNSPAANTDPYGLIAAGDMVDLTWTGSGYSVGKATFTALDAGFHNLVHQMYPNIPDSEIVFCGAAAVGNLAGLSATAAEIAAITAPFVVPVVTGITIGVVSYFGIQAWQNLNTNTSDVTAFPESKSTNPMHTTSNGGGSGQGGKPSKPSDLQKPQWHHDLPQKFINEFKKRGIDINDPRFGRWIEGGPIGGHQKFSREFNQLWENFLARNPTVDQIFEFMGQMRSNPKFQ